MAKMIQKIFIREGRESDTMKKNEKEIVEEKKVKVEKKEKTGQENRNMLPIIIIIVIIVVALILAFTVFKVTKKSLKEELTTELKTMGEEFYKDFYYTEISKNKSKSEVSEFLGKFSDIGVKVNLDNLSRYDSNKNKEKVKKFKNEKGDACNQTTTQAIIYPKSPYGKSDYKVEVDLDCNFSSSENK